MMRGYSRDININNHEINLTAILSGGVTPLSDFESETFSFIKDWLHGVGSFKLHTSGSTGTSKEILLTRKQLQQSAQRTIIAFDLNGNDTAFVCLDTKYIAGKMMLVRALESNMKIVAVEPTSNPLQELSSDTSLSFAAFVPLQLREMLKYSDSTKKLNQLKAIIIGGGEVNASLQQAMQKLSCPTYATYGMTETVSHIALQLLGLFVSNGGSHSEHPHTKSCHEKARKTRPLSHPRSRLSPPQYQPPGEVAGRSAVGDRTVRRHQRLPSRPVVSGRRDFR